MDNNDFFGISYNFVGLDFKIYPGGFFLRCPDAPPSSPVQVREESIPEGNEVVLDTLQYLNFDIFGTPLPTKAATTPPKILKKKRSRSMDFEYVGSTRKSLKF